MAVQMADTNLDCRRCSPPQRSERGCELDSPIPGYWKFDDFEINRCPVKLITGQSLKLLEAYAYFRQGFLPNSGGWGEQPGKLLEAFEVIEAEIRKIKESKEQDSHAN